MKVIGLNQKEYKWSYKRYKGKTKCSKYHKRTRVILVSVFPFDLIYEEVPMPGTKTERQTRSLVADFWIPQRLLIIETQGEQHYKFNSHFFNNKIEFYQAKARDRIKEEWCIINNIKLIQLPYYETDVEWVERIRNGL